MTEMRALGHLVIAYCDLFGIWDLEIGIWITGRDKR
jgi:hypothetical protein